MPQSAAEAFVGKSGDVFLAPVGTTLPQPGDDPLTAVLDSAFISLGYLSEEGVSESLGREVTDFNVWQNLQPIRREPTASNIAYEFQIVQWNAESIAFALGGGTVTDHGNDVFSYELPAAETALDERSAVFEVKDGDRTYWFVIERGNITGDVSVQYQRGSLATFGVTYSVLAPEGGGAPGWKLFNDPHFALAGS